MTMAEEKLPLQDDLILPVPISLIGGADTPAPMPPSCLASHALYTIFTRKEKVMIVVLGSVAASLSGFTANIYYPALNDLSHDLGVSYNLITLSITTYLIFQGLVPTFVGSFSDAVGRRPAYLICFALYLAANIGLALQDSYTALMLLRCLQSCGSSGTIALGNAMVSDIVTTSERGSYIGYASIGALTGPAVRPIIGGLLNQFLGWRAIFWFLVVLSGTIFLAFLIFLPETCRKVVGDGSRPAQPWNISLINYLRARHLQKSGKSPLPLPRLSRKRLNPLGSLSIIFSKEGAPILLYTGLLFGGFYTVVAAIPSDFRRTYNFNSLQIGLCYIPLGCGSMTAAVLTGKAVDWNFRRHARRLNFPITKGRQPDIRHFPIQRARLEVTCPLMLLGSLTIVAYGWVMHSTRALAGPLILLYFLAFSISGSFSSLSTLMVDFYPESPGTATAASNLVRCWIGAAAVAGVGPFLDEVGTGWTGVLVAVVWVCCAPLLWVVLRWGPGWREEKRVRDERERMEESEKGRRKMMWSKRGLSRIHSEY